MGTVVFQWQEEPQYQLLLLHNTDNWHDRVFKAACWWDEDDETKDMFGGRCEITGGTWFGCSKQGRVAFLVNVSPFSNDRSELLPVKFLKGKITPREFAKELDRNINLSLGCSFHLIVADIPSNSMVYISKNSTNNETVGIDEVGPSFHVISSGGINYRRSKHLKDKFRETVIECMNRESPMKVIADKMQTEIGETSSYDPLEAKEGNNASWHGTKSTTAFAVKHTGRVSFYEKYLENGEWKTQDIDFNIWYPQ